MSPSAPMRSPFAGADDRGRVGRLAQVAHGGGERGDVVDAVCAYGSDRWPARRGQPHASRQRARGAVARQRGNRRHVVGNAAHLSSLAIGDPDGRLPTRLQGCHPGIRASEYPGARGEQGSDPSRRASRSIERLEARGLTPSGSRRRHERSHREIRECVDRHSQPPRGAQCHGRDERRRAGGGVRAVRHGR